MWSCGNGDLVERYRGGRLDILPLGAWEWMGVRVWEVPSLGVRGVMSVDGAEVGGAEVGGAVKVRFDA